MTETCHFTSPQGRKIAYHLTKGQGPGVVFLGGFGLDMTGTKAIFLQGWAEREGRAFLRFDYSGHGQSSGAFTDGCIGDWAEDAKATINHLTRGPQILIGSSMGGWIALLIARDLATRVAGLVGIAAAPDFTEDQMWAEATAAQRHTLLTRGRIALPSDFSDQPTIITSRLIDDGRSHLVLRTPLKLPFPVRLLQGTDDVDVPPAVALRLFDHVNGPNIRLTLVKGADHRFSTPDCLHAIELALNEVVVRLADGGHDQ